MSNLGTRLSLDELRWKVAAMETDCPRYYSTTRFSGEPQQAAHPLTCLCRGTGKAKRFPAMSQPCPGSTCVNGVYKPFGEPAIPHYLCMSTGIIPAPPDLALLQASLIKAGLIAEVVDLYESWILAPSIFEESRVEGVRDLILLNWYQAAVQVAEKESK